MLKKKSFDTSLPKDFISSIFPWTLSKTQHISDKNWFNTWGFYCSEQSKLHWDTLEILKMLKQLKTKLYEYICCLCERFFGSNLFSFSFSYVCFRAEIKRQKQRSQELEIKLETDHNTIYEVRVTHTGSHKY